jgi:hypothetical protein
MSRKLDETKTRTKRCSVAIIERLKIMPEIG